MIWAGGHCPLTWSKSWKLMTITLSLTEWTFQQCWILWTLCLSMCEARRKIGGSLWELCLAHTCRLAPAAGEKPMRRKGSRTSSKRLFLSAWPRFLDSFFPLQSWSESKGFQSLNDGIDACMLMFLTSKGHIKLGWGLHMAALYWSIRPSSWHAPTLPDTNINTLHRPPKSILLSRCVIL
jgi:hypothetical protein